MFRVKSSLKRELEIKAPIEKVLGFFADLTNLAEMLWGVEGIRRETAGTVRWTIATDTPVGRIRFSFPVRDTSPNPNTIEWSPALNETQNLLRYSLKFSNSNKMTRVELSQQVELRRKRAWDLHPGVALMGEGRLNSALQRRIDAAIDDFLVRVKERLEEASHR
jgi:carbon monoxide dehydrogenase subunit G